jgi:hypothetical protein
MTSRTDISLTRTVPAAVIRGGIQQVFVNRLKRAKEHARRVVVISPWITARDDPSSLFSLLVQVIRSRRLPAYFVTRRPENFAHVEAIEILKSCPTVEFVYNDSVHAKIYTVTGLSPHGFALRGSANLTVRWNFTRLGYWPLVLALAPQLSKIWPISVSAIYKSTQSQRSLRKWT